MVADLASAPPAGRCWGAADRARRTPNLETTMTATKAKIVFEATHDWYEINGADFSTADDWREDAMAVVVAAGKIPEYLAECDEAWAVTITAVDPAHTAIRVGDVCVSEGSGSDKYFVRMA